MSVKTVLAAHIIVGDRISPAKHGPFREVVRVVHHPLSVSLTLEPAANDTAHHYRYRIRPGYERAFWVQEPRPNVTSEVSA